MKIGDEVETTCEYSRMSIGKPFKGIIRELCDKHDNVVRVEMECGCMTSISRYWLKKRHCSWLKKKHCSCCCTH